MFKLLCLLILNALMVNWVYARPQPQNDVQPPNYLPCTDHDYLSYSGPEYYGQSHNQAYNQHYQQSYPSPLYTPPGTYFDQRRGILRPFPGGGVPVLVDYHKRCSNDFVGLKAHPEEHQYYYVCKPDCVIFGKCQNLQIFNSTNGQCVQHSPPEYMPTCTAVGRFPLFSDCHLYYKCEEDLKAKIFSCPSHMIFSSVSQKCIIGNKCTPTQISPESSYLPEYCAYKFPPCYENGVFRSPSDCSLYYNCELQNNGIYLQTRLRCPSGQFYDLKTSNCLPAEQVPCDCIQVAELVYPQTNGLPAVYPVQFDLDSLEEKIYPIEKTEAEISINKSEKDDEVASDISESTTALVHFKAEPKIGDIDLSSFLQEHPEMSKQITISSEQTTSTEGSGLTTLELGTTLTDEDVTNQFVTSTFNSATEIQRIGEPDTLRITTTTDSNPGLRPLQFDVEENTKVPEISSNIPEEPATTIFSEPGTIPDVMWSSEIQTTTDSASHSIPDEVSSSTSFSNTMPKENSTTTASITMPNETNKTEVVVTAVSQPLHCVETNEINSDDDNFGNKDTLTAQSLAKACKQTFTIPSQDTTKSPDTDQQQTKTITHASEFTRGSRSALVKQKITPTTLTTIHLEPTTNLKTDIGNEIKQDEVEEDFFSPQTIENDTNNLNQDTFQDDNDDDGEMKPSVFSEEEFLPVHSKTTAIEKQLEQTTDFDYITRNPEEESSFDIEIDYDYTTITSKIALNTKPSSQLNPTEGIPRKTESIEFVENLIKVPKTEDILPSIKVDNKVEAKTATVLKRRQTNLAESANTLETTTATAQENETFSTLEQDLPLDVKDVAKKEVTVSILPIDSTSPLPHTLSNTSKYIQTSTITPSYTLSTNDCCIRVREQQVPDTNDNNKKKKLCYILRTKPMNKTITTTSNNNNNINDIITETSCLQTNNENIPHLEIIAERPLDVHFKICPTNCDKSHQHNFSPAGNRAVFVRWFANKSNQTLGFEAANEVNTLGDGKKDY